MVYGIWGFDMTLFDKLKEGARRKFSPTATEQASDRGMELRKMEEDSHYYKKKAKLSNAKTNYERSENRRNKLGQDKKDYNFGGSSLGFGSDFGGGGFDPVFGSSSGGRKKKGKGSGSSWSVLD